MSLENPNDMRVEIVHGKTYVSVEDLIIQITASAVNLGINAQALNLSPVSVEICIRTLTGMVEFLGHINNGTLDTLDLPTDLG